MPAGLYAVAAAVLIAAALLTFGGGEESDAYKDGYDTGIALYNDDEEADQCEIRYLSSLSVGERFASPDEREDYESGCRDGFGDAESEDD